MVYKKPTFSSQILRICEQQFGSNTIEQFQTFLRFLLEEQENQSTLISSQANSGGLEGSETRAYDPERVMKLHERLEELKTYLNSIWRCFSGFYPPDKNQKNKRGFLV
jgi:hypothetical protein